MDRAEAEHLEGIIFREARTGFGAGAVERVAVIRPEDDPAVEPGELLVRVIIPAGDAGGPAGPSGGDSGDSRQRVLDGWAAQHAVGMRRLRRALSLRLPPARVLEFTVSGDDGPRITMPHDEELASTPVSAREAAHEVARLLRTSYIFPERGEQAAAALVARAEAGEYDELGDEVLAERLTAQLYEVCSDKHLRVEAVPPPGQRRGPGREPEPGPGPEREPGHEPGPGLKPGPRRGPGPGRPGPGRGPGADEPGRGGRPRPGRGRLVNFGIGSVQRLDGNVGYIEIRGVPEPGDAGGAIAAAMELVAHTYALILDLRRNGGGSPHGATFWCSYLFAGAGTHLNDIYEGETRETRQFWSLPYVPGQRYLERPVYVLTSGRTFSGGEDIAYALQAQGRATVVGETTGGGAHPTRGVRISETLVASVPFARSVNPVTGTNWEGTGVVPDVAVAADQARDVAYGLALRQVLADAERLDDVPPPLTSEARRALGELPPAPGGDGGTGVVGSGAGRIGDAAGGATAGGDAASGATDPG